MSQYERQHSDDEKTWTACDCAPDFLRGHPCNKPSSRVLRDGMVIEMRWNRPDDVLTGRVFDPPIRPDLPWGEQVEIDPKRIVSPKPAPTMCGCGRHEIDPKGDPYAQHREWSYKHDPREWHMWSEAAHRSVRGVGVSAPQPKPLAVQDPTGDDVARDAYRTTGGRTLDDVIDAHAAAVYLVIGGKRHRVTSVEIEYAPDAEGWPICTKYEVGTSDGQVHRRLKSDDFTISYECAWRGGRHPDGTACARRS
jgi:hypothetical protein